MSFELYLEGQQNNLEQIIRLHHFRELIPAVNDLYELSITLVPENARPQYGRSLVTCHKGFLSAAALIARGQPDDSGAITRRVIEAARIARAIKHDPTNLNRWRAYEARRARWQARQESRRPRHLNPRIRYPEGDENLDWLQAQIGSLSDALVHFTPEFFDNQAWRINRGEETVQVRLQYFEPDQREIERALVLLGGVHMRVIDLFNECFDGAFSGNQQWVTLRLEVQRRGLALSRPFEPGDRPQEDR